MKSCLDQWSWRLLLAGIFLVPLFYLPGFGLATDVSKRLFLVPIVLLALILWLLAKMATKSIVIPNNPILLTGALFLFVYLLSTLWSDNLRLALSGYSAEIPTFLFVFCFCALAFLSAIYFQTKKRLLILYFGVALSFVLIILAQIVLLSLGSTIVLLSRWGDLAIFAGLIVISSLAVLEFLETDNLPGFQLLIDGLLVVAVIILLLTNFMPVWAAVSVFALLSLAARLWLRRQEESFHPTALIRPSLIVFLISLFLILPGVGTITYNSLSRLDAKIGINSLEVRPALSATWSVAGKTLAAHPILGPGPNRFGIEWRLYKPADLNQGEFWNTDFIYGYGVLPSLPIAAGGLGLLSALIVFLVLIWQGIATLLSFRTGDRGRSLLLLPVAGLAYLLIWILIYVPETAIMVYLAVFTGALIGGRKMFGLDNQIEVRWSKTNLLTPLPVLMVILLISSAVLFYVYTGEARSVYYWQKSLYSESRGRLEEGEKSLELAIAAHPTDLYYREATNVYLAQLNQILKRSDLQTDNLVARVKQFSEQALKSASSSLVIDVENYLNHESAGKVYEQLAVLGVKGAYDRATEAYNQALKRCPNNPALFLNLARLAAVNKNLVLADEYLIHALRLKPDYTDAIFLKTQLLVARGQTREAIANGEATLQTNPNNLNLLFQLGYLYYQIKNYDDSAINLEKALVINPAFANAKYFLGLDYARQGLTTKAIVEFENIGKLNPSNQEVKKILGNLRAGQDPLTP